MNAPGLIIPQKQETNAVRRGRDILKRIMLETMNAVDAGKTPLKIVVGGGFISDIKQFFDFASKFDGHLPKRMHGLPIEYTESNEKKVTIVCRKS